VRCYSCICGEGVRNPLDPIRIASLLSQIRTEHLLNTNPKFYNYAGPSDDAVQFGIINRAMWYHNRENLDTRVNENLESQMTMCCYLVLYT
jgi:hypothetical protein